jgi:hypothetical protein
MRDIRFLSVLALGGHFIQVNAQQLLAAYLQGDEHALWHYIYMSPFHAC